MLLTKIIKKKNLVILMDIISYFLFYLSFYQLIALFWMFREYLKSNLT